MKESIFQFAINEASKIDAKKGIIYGVSVITEGEALGHSYQYQGNKLPMMIDEETINQVMQAAKTYAGGLKVKMNHTSDAASIVGSLRNFRIDGTQLRADLHLLNKSDCRDYIIELAEEIPDQFGLSISFSGSTRVIGDQAFASCEEIYSADIVDAPACNAGGMFSIPEIKEDVVSVDIPEMVNMANPAPAPTPAMDEDNKLDQQTLDAVVALTKIVNDFIASQQAEETQEEEDDDSSDSEMSAKLDAALSKLAVIEEASKGATPVTSDVVTNEDIVARFESITDESAKVEFAKTHHAALKKVIPVKN